MNRAEREAAAILAEQQAARERAPRAHAFADDLREFLDSEESQVLTAEERDRWERVLICVGDIDGRRYADMTEKDDWLVSEFDLLKEQARQHGAVRR